LTGGAGSRTILEFFEPQAQAIAMRRAEVPLDTRHLQVGGLVAVGCDAAERFLLTVSHSGRGVFSTETWERLARRHEVVYPTDGRIEGIGPLEGMSIRVIESYDGSVMRLRVAGWDVAAESSGITVSRPPHNPAQQPTSAPRGAPG
jgi:hypothetical protein